jgi:CubicO group peptidase (beta-lactamase class C family)
MSASAIERFLTDRIAARFFPGASYLVAAGDRILAEGALGRAVVEPQEIAARRETLYDLASLSKPLATGLLAVLLQRDGLLSLDDPLARHLPSWHASDARDEVTLLDLLVHCSGLPDWRPLYLHARDREGRVEWLRRVALAYPPRTDVVYSCLGYILAGFALEAAGGATLERLFEERIARPLGARDLLYRPPESQRARIAATERGNLREQSLAGQQGARYNDWRTGLIWGEVHDTNARTLGGVAGNAGLFGTARAVHALAVGLLDTAGGLLRPEERLLLRRSVTPGLAEERAVGFQVASTRGSSAGSGLPPVSFGHTGFTGTSLWIDPEAGRIYILLTNRVHPHYQPHDMHSVRREFHAIAARL